VTDILLLFRDKLIHDARNTEHKIYIVIVLLERELEDCVANDI
jgi:hypothetical protein